MKKIKCKECGAQEFITEPNRYDIYEVIDNKLGFQRSEQVDEEIKLYCRDCSEELEGASDIIE
jgi:ribosomal protein L33